MTAHPRSVHPRPAHVAMVSIPAPGHVNPSLEVVRRLVERGHRVTYANDPSFRDVVESTGAELAPYGSTLPRPNHAGAQEAGEPAFAGDTIDHLTTFQADYEAMLPQLRERYEHDRPDLFLYDIAAVPARILADEWGVPIVQLSPTYVAWEGYEADMADVLASILADPRGVALREREAAFLRANGVSADPLTYLGRPPRSVVLVPEVLQPNADRVDRDVYTFTGPAVRRPDPAVTWAPPADRRVLLVSLGTAFTRLPDFYRRCLQAYGDLPGWHVVLQVGQHVTLDELTRDAPLPGNVEVHPWVPQREVLEHADAFVTHAGMGGSAEGMVTGTPMIAAPQDVDQFDNADALVAAGIAVRVEAASVTAAELRAALDRVSAPDVVARSREVAADIAGGGGADRAVEVVESLLPG